MLKDIGLIVPDKTARYDYPPRHVNGMGQNAAPLTEPQQRVDSVPTQTGLEARLSTAKQ